jgi:hypothetical protein
MVKYQGGGSCLDLGRVLAMHCNQLAHGIGVQLAVVFKHLDLAALLLNRDHCL